MGAVIIFIISDRWRLEEISSFPCVRDEPGLNQAIRFLLDLTQKWVLSDLFLWDDIITCMLPQIGHQWQIKACFPWSPAWGASDFIGLSCRAWWGVTSRSVSDPKAVAPSKISPQRGWQFPHSCAEEVPTSVDSLPFIYNSNSRDQEATSCYRIS